MNRALTLLAVLAMTTAAGFAPDARGQTESTSRGFVEIQRNRAAEQGARAVRRSLFDAMQRQRVLFHLSQSRRIALQGAVARAAIRSDSAGNGPRQGSASVAAALARPLVADAIPDAAPGAANSKRQSPLPSPHRSGGTEDEYHRP